MVHLAGVQVLAVVEVQVVRQAVTATLAATEAMAQVLSLVLEVVVREVLQEVPLEVQEFQAVLRKVTQPVVEAGVAYTSKRLN